MFATRSKRNEPAPMQAPAPEQPKHRLYGRAALAREDAADAKRRMPDTDFSGYAAARGLDHLGSRNAAGFFAALPLDERLQFNVMRGDLAGGRYGLLFHHLVAWPVDEEGLPEGGPFYNIVWNPPLKLEKGWWKQMIPVAGVFFNDPEPTKEAACGVPCTAAATLVPETAWMPGRMSIHNHGTPWMVPGHREKLKDRDLPDWTLQASVEPPPGLVDRLLTGPLRALLEYVTAARPAYFTIEIEYGTVTITRNGFVKDEQQFDALANLVCLAGDAIADAFRAQTAPQPFDRPLAPADWPEQGVSMNPYKLGDPWLVPVHALEHRLGLTLEEPQAYHLAFPSVPVPGQAMAVLRGRIPGTEQVGRIAFHTEKSVFRHNDGRNAVLLPARPGAAETAPAGVRLADRRLNYAVRDGIFVVWELRSSGRLGELGDVDTLIRRTVELGRELGAID
jgi:hypothetical protein